MQIFLPQLRDHTRLLGDSREALKDHHVVVAQVPVLDFARELQWTALLLFLAEHGLPLFCKAVPFKLSYLFIKFIILFKYLRELIGPHVFVQSLLGKLFNKYLA